MLPSGREVVLLTPAPDAVIAVHLWERTGVTGEEHEGAWQWHRHDKLTLWPALGSEAAGPMRFVDILTDSDGDGVGDVNERLAGFSPEDVGSMPGDSVIDVLPLYDAEFRELAGSSHHTIILHQMSVAGTMFEDNGTGIRLRIVGMSEFENERNKAGLEVRRELMDAHGADITVWFSPAACPGLQAAGCAALGTNESQWWEDSGRGAEIRFSSPLTVAHELGHVMGLVHSARQGEAHGAWRWSRGHYMDSQRLGDFASFRGTIMSYGTRSLGGVFSNPDADCWGSPCGVAAGELDGVDSVRTLNLLRFQIAANRASEADADGDGFVDPVDGFPDDPGDWLDSDGDGIGDNADPDDDNNGAPDLEDRFPLNPDEWLDVDGDGIGDNADDDVRDLSPFRDSGLRGAVEAALGKEAGATITAQDMAGLTTLDYRWWRVGGSRIRDLTGLELATGLERLSLKWNAIRDLSPLSGLTELGLLDLEANRISDIGPLVDHSIMRTGWRNPGYVRLDGNPLNFQSVVEHIPTLRSRSIAVKFLLTEASIGSASASAITDPTLRSIIAEELAEGLWRVDDPEILDQQIHRLKELRIHGSGIETLAGLDAATGLAQLHAASNRIADLSPLAELPNLSTLDLRHNRISDLSPLVANAGLAEGDSVALEGNPLSEKSLNAHIPALLERGVDVSVASVQLALAAGGVPVRFDVSGYFATLLGDGVRMTASSSDLSLAEADAKDGALVVIPGNRGGSAVVTVEAANGRGDIATLMFAVEVRGPQLVPLFPNASGSRLRQGFVRVINHSPRSGVVDIAAVDDAGMRSSPLALAIGAGEAVHFNSGDFEAGNPDKGLSGSGGTGAGDWWLHFHSSNLDVEVLSYIRTPDGFVTAMHDVVPKSADGHSVPFFNPASNFNQVSLLRITNLGGEGAEVTIAGIDARCESPGGDVRAHVAAGATLTLTAGELEAGGAGLEGRLGDGVGKCRLLVNSEGDLSVMNLLLSPEGYLSNLSTSASAALLDADGTHHVPLFPSASDPLRQGFVRVVNRTGRTGVVRIRPYDDAGREYDALMLALDARQSAHFNSDDLELGAASKGLSGSAGPGTSDWRLELSSDLDIEVLAYVRTAAGFLTSMHDVARRSRRRHEVSLFNPASNTSQVSWLRIVNPNARPAHVSVGGFDDQGVPGADSVRMTVPSRASVVVRAVQLEGAERYPFRVEGALGDGAGKWRLVVDSEQPLLVMSLLGSPTGHLTNLSTTPACGR